MGDIMSGAAFNRGGSKQNYKTPADFMAAIKARFGAPEFDLAADESNKQTPHYFSIEEDSLKQDWHKIEVRWLWLNPPFDRIEPWAAKCAEESVMGANILFLVPASVGSEWYRKYVQFNAVTLALNGRLHFDPTNPTWGYPKDCMLCVFCAGLYGFNVWKWK